MAQRWTENQRKAIETRGGALTVSAAAGSGKTAVLVERAVRLITDEEKGIPADRLLIVTYTRLAAAELRTRLFDALAQRIEKNPADRYLLRQQTLLSKAHISTIHAFCQSVVKEFFYELDVDRNFRIADESELSVVKADAMKLTLDGLYAEKSGEYRLLLETFATHRDDARLAENILRIHEFLLSHPFPKKWMEEKLSYYDDFSDVADSVWGKIIENFTKDTASHMEKLQRASVEALAYDESFQKVIPLFESDGAFLERLKAAVDKASWDGIRAALKSFEPGKLLSPKGMKDHPSMLKAKENRKEFKASRDTLLKLYERTFDDCEKDILHLKTITRAMFKAVTAFSENFGTMKKERGIVDFSDLEHLMLLLLVDEETGEKTAAADEIAARFDEIMVDEFQDANETQDTLFKALSKNGENLFVVGDVKQSIYGFRQAMPEIFQKRKNDAALYDEKHPAFPAKIILEKNFRSAEPITKAVNFFFERLMSESVGDIRYDDEEKLVCGAVYEKTEDAAVELDIIDREALFEEDASVAEAKFIAEKIFSMISSRYQVKDKNASGEFYRDVTFGDFAVLMRTKKQAPVYVDMLAQCGVRAASSASHSFLDAYEIMIISNFLRVINNPALDVELLSVLMCPVFAFSEDDLARMRAGQRKTSLFQSLMKDAENGNEKSARFLRELAFYRGLSATVTLEKLIRTVFDRSAFLSILEASSENGLVGDNLRLFLDYAKGFEQNTKKGLSSFLSYLDRLSETKTDLPGAPGTADAAQNAVQVMSIHASKGLEFPVTFIANTARQFNSDTKENVILDAKYGLALKRRDETRSAVFSTMPREALKLEKKRAEMSEELRILYVGMTRAKQKLIMTASVKNAEDYVKRIAGKIAAENEISPYIVRTSTLFSDWLLMCALLHPDAKKLRELCPAGVTAQKEADFRFETNIIKTTVFSDEAGEEEEKEKPEIEADESVIEELLRHEAFQYPFDGLRNLPVKVAASSLAHRLSSSAFDRILSAPAFLSDEKLSAADRGTALHAFMQYADFEKAQKDLDAELRRLQNEGYLSEVQAQSIDAGRAKAFLNSDVVTRCLKSKNVFKEYRFTVQIPAKMVQSDIGEQWENEQVVLQGAVDLAFEEDGELVIVDYKTDRVKTADALREMYASQLGLYRNALEECLGMRVKECFIYSIFLGEKIKVENFFE